MDTDWGGRVSGHIICCQSNGNKDTGGTKVSTEKVQKRTIIETVNASGKIYLSWR
jgi:hypothetical protein